MNYQRLPQDSQSFFCSSTTFTTHSARLRIKLTESLGRSCYGSKEKSGPDELVFGLFMP